MTTPRKVSGRVRITDPKLTRIHREAKAHGMLIAVIKKAYARDRKTLREAARELRLIAALLEEIGDLPE